MKRMMMFSHLIQQILVPSVFSQFSPLLPSTPVIITSSHNKMRQRIHFVAFTSPCAVLLVYPWWVDGGNCVFPTEQMKKKVAGTSSGLDDQKQV